jgi:hypothetical protein
MILGRTGQLVYLVHDPGLEPFQTSGNLRRGTEKRPVRAHTRSCPRAGRSASEAGYQLQNGNMVAAVMLEPGHTAAWPSSLSSNRIPPEDARHDRTDDKRGPLMRTFTRAAAAAVLTALGIAAAAGAATAAAGTAAGAAAVRSAPVSSTSASSFPGFGGGSSGGGGAGGSW